MRNDLEYGIYLYGIETWFPVFEVGRSESGEIGHGDDG